MSIFEFISVSVAIVLALALGRLMTAAQDVFDRKRRDYLHLGFYLVCYVVVLSTWWAQWMLVGVERWTFLDFVLVMASPIALYFTVHSLVSSNPSDVENWRIHFDQQRRWFFSALLVTVVAVAARRVFVAEESLLRFPIFLGFNILAVAWAIASKARPVHILALVIWIVTLSYAITLQFAIEPSA